MEAVEAIQKHITLVHEVNVNTSADKIWNFLIHIEKNYSAWHPGDHILFQWTKGAPFEAGAPNDQLLIYPTRPGLAPQQIKLPGLLGSSTKNTPL